MSPKIRKSSRSTKVRVFGMLAWIAAAGLLAVWILPAMFSTQANDDAAAIGRKIRNFDIRDDDVARKAFLDKHQLGAPGKLADLGQKMKAAQERLKSRINDLDIGIDRNTGAPEVLTVLSAARKLTGRSSAPREQVLRNFIAANSDVYGLDRASIDSLQTSADYTNPSGNMSYVELQQKIDGIPVFQGSMVGGMTKEGELIATSGKLIPGLDPNELRRMRERLLGDPGIGDKAAVNKTLAARSAAAAVAAGADSIGINIDPSDLVVKEISEDGTSVTFEQGPFVQDLKAELVYFPLEAGSATLTWSTTLWQDVPAYYTLVDAEGQELLWRKNITNDQTQTATFAYYNDDSPAPLSPFIGLPGSNIQSGAISRTTSAILSELPAFDDLGWITDGGTTTTGNNVDAGLDISSPNGIDAGGRPVSPTRNFVYDYDPAPGLGIPGSSAPSDTDYRWGAVSNLFVWSNRYHDILYQYGFTEASRNFQGNNFGRNPGGGTANAIAGNDSVRAEAQDYSGTNNANFSTGTDGNQPRMQMYIWPNTNPDRDGDLDQTVIIHELTHGTSNRLHNNASGLRATISGGMGEGWGDFYARMILSSAGEDVDGIYGTGQYATHLAASGFTDNYYYGIRRFPHAVKSNVGPNGKPHNPLTLADIDPNQIDLTDGAFARGPFGVGGDYGAVAVHNMGEVWSMTLMEVRARIIHRLGWAAGNARMLQLTTDAMKLEGTNPTHLVGRNAFLAADVAFGSEDAKDIWAGFATRGMGYGASITPEATLTSSSIRQNVVESFDNPIPGMGAVAVSETTCSSDGRVGVGENVVLTIPLTNPFSDSITGVSAQVTGGGSANYGTIAPGATVSRNISYHVPNDTACGSKITVSVVVNSNLGIETKTFKVRIGTPTPIFTENFDGVTAPALPAGWSTGNSGAMPLFATSTTSPDSGPNAAAITFAGSTSSSELVSPSIAVPATGAQLSFRHSFLSELEFDGAVLEISINGGPFVDIVDAGGTFEEGAYNWAFARTADGNTSVLQSRAGWTGTSSGYITTTVNLPASANGQNVQFKFRGASDSSASPTGSVWRIDSIVLNGFICPSLATTTTVAPASVQYSDTVNLSATLSADCDYPEGSMEFRVDGTLVGTVPVSGTGTYSTPYSNTTVLGNHTIKADFISSNPFFANSSDTDVLTVTQESARVTFPASNPSSVVIPLPGGTAAPFNFCADISEIPDGSPGLIANPGTFATISFVPILVGPTPSTSPIVYSGGGVGGTLRACTTVSGVTLNGYSVVVTVGGNYTGTGYSSLGASYPGIGVYVQAMVINNGNLANFGFDWDSVQKSSKVNQSFTYVEHRASGDVSVVSKSVASIKRDGNTAVITARVSINGAGNYLARITLVDNGDPGTSDKIGMDIRETNGSIMSDLSFSPKTISVGRVRIPGVSK